MFLQLGNIIFKGLLSPNTFSVDGDAATYAEHQLASGKPRLQKTGDELEEITLEMTFHAEFCKPEDQIKLLKTAKSSGTVMPLLMGNGKYRGDYVIISNPYTVNQALSDGTVVSATITLNIKEYVSYDKLEQKQLEARSSAFALGDKNPVIARNPQPEDITKSITRSITAAKQQATKVDGLTNDFKNNVSNRAVLAKKINNACTQATNNIDDLNKQLENAREVNNTFTGIKGAATNFKTAVTGVSSLYPFNNPTDLLTANTYLQSTVTTFSSTSAPLLELVTVRQPIQ